MSSEVAKHEAGIELRAGDGISEGGGGGGAGAGGEAGCWHARLADTGACGGAVGARGRRQLQLQTQDRGRLQGDRYHAVGGRILHRERHQASV